MLLFFGVLGSVRAAMAAVGMSTPRVTLHWLGGMIAFEALRELSLHLKALQVIDIQVVFCMKQIVFVRQEWQR